MAPNALIKSGMDVTTNLHYSKSNMNYYKKSKTSSLLEPIHVI
jgi:hypothetical protein